MDRSRLLIALFIGLLAVGGWLFWRDRGSRDHEADRSARRDRGAGTKLADQDDFALGGADEGDDDDGEDEDLDPLELEVTVDDYGLRAQSRFSVEERERNRSGFRGRFAGLAQGGDPELADCLELARWAADKEIPDLYGLVLRYTLILHSGSREARRRLASLRRSLRRLPVDLAAGRDLLTELGTEFRLLRTPHFRLAYATEEPFARQTGVLLEKVYGAFFRFFAARHFEPVPPADRIEVVIFGTREDYRRHTARFGDHLTSTSGVFSSRDNRSYFYDALNEPSLDRARQNIADNVSKLERYLEDLDQGDPSRSFNITIGGQSYTGISPARAGQLMRAEIRRQQQEKRRLDGRYRGRNISRAAHEIVHHLAFAAGIHGLFRKSPSWLMEGLAMHFEAVDLSSGKWLGPGGGNDARQKGFRRDLEARQQVSLEELVRSDRLFRTGGKPMNRAYNAAWALFQYLLGHHHDPLFDLMANLSIAVATERPTEEDRRREFTRVFGPLPELERRWLRSF
ncbi:MAG: DUF1570 domain-containing protein [bacterium]